MTYLTKPFFALLLLAFVSLGGTWGFAATPTVTSFTPKSGAIGTTLTVTGTNFTSPATIIFSGGGTVAATVTSSTTLSAVIPVSAYTGKFKVQTPGGSVQTTSSFTVLPGIDATNSSLGTPSSTQTVYFSGFGASEAVDIYFDNQNIALGITSDYKYGQVVTTIPATAYPGVHYLTAIGHTSGITAQKTFTVRTDWSQLGFTANHPGNNPFENVISTSTIDQLDEAWETPAIGSMVSTPADAGGYVYATFSDGTLRSFDELTGTQRWSVSTGGSTAFSSPAVAAGRVYVGSSSGSLYAFKTSNKALLWSFPTGDIVYSSPTVSNGIVYFGSYDKKVYALNASTGALIWSFTTGAAVYSSPTVINGVVYVGSFDNNLYALNATTGVKIWQAPTTGLILASPVQLGNLICVGSEDKIMYAFRASTGALAWSYTTTGVIDSTAALIGTTLYFGTADGKVYSLTASGALRWSYPVSTAAPIRSPLCAANGIVYATDGLYTYAFTSSGVLQTVLPIGSTYGGPIVVNGGLLAGDKIDGILARYTTY